MSPRVESALRLGISDGRRCRAEGLAREVGEPGEPPPPEGADIPGAHQGGDSRWSGDAKLYLDRNLTAPPVRLAEGGTAPTEAWSADQSRTGAPTEYPLDLNVDVLPCAQGDPGESKVGCSQFSFCDPCQFDGEKAIWAKGGNTCARFCIIGR